MSPSLVNVIAGTAYIPVTNVSGSSVTLKSCCSLAIVSPFEVVSLPSGLQEVPCEQNKIVATVRLHTAGVQCRGKFGGLIFLC